MSPIAHFVGSWLVASVATNNPRDRKLITLAGVLPDLDGLGLVADYSLAFFTDRENTYHLYHQYHHVFAHGWPAALILAVVLTGFARRRVRTFLFCLVTFHLHLLCDLLGSRGPSPADLWPISYGEPLFRHPIWIWKGQWKLDGWQNQTVFVVLFAAALCQATRIGHSFVEVFSTKADATFVAVLRKWRAVLPGRRADRAP